MAPTFGAGPLYLGGSEIEAAYVGAVSVYQSALPLDADAAAYLSAVEQQDGQALEAGVRSAVNVFVTACKASGVWASMNTAVLLAGARTLAGSRVALKGSAPSTSGFVDADRTRTGGLKAVGTSAKTLSTNVALNGLQQNNHHLAVWVAQAQSGTRATYICGGNSGLGASEINAAGTSGGDLFLRHADNSGSYLSVPGQALATGLLAITRSSSSGFTCHHGATSTFLNAGSYPPQTRTIRLWQREGQFYGNSRVGFYSIGTNVDTSALSNALSTLFTSLASAIP